MENVVITGASRGIGLELCRLYLHRGERVYAVCRKPSKELLQLQDDGIQVIAGVDVAADDGAKVLLAGLVGQKIHLLINNAGILANNQLGQIDYANVQHQILVNAVAPLRITEALLPNLIAGAKVVLITSRMGSIADNTSGSYYGYRMSKAALNAAGVSLARDLHPRGIAVALLHPGFVQTQMVGFAGDITPAVAAERLAVRIEELNMQNSGGFWHSDGERLPW